MSKPIGTVSDELPWGMGQMGSTPSLWLPPPRDTRAPTYQLPVTHWLGTSGFLCAQASHVPPRNPSGKELQILAAGSQPATLRVAVVSGRVGAHLPHSVALNKLLNLSAPVFFLRGKGGNHIVRINELGHAEPLDQRAWHVISAI